MRLSKTWRSFCWTSSDTWGDPKPHVMLAGYWSTRCIAFGLYWKNWFKGIEWNRKQGIIFRKRNSPVEILTEVPWR